MAGKVRILILLCSLPFCLMGQTDSVLNANLGQAGEQVYDLKDIEEAVWLNEAISTVKVVGLGVPTVGAQNVDSFMNEMVERMIRDHGFRTIIIEANFTHSLALDHYIQTGEGDPVKIVEGFESWSWRKQSLIDLLGRLHHWNESNPGAQVKLRGINVKNLSHTADTISSLLKKYAPRTYDKYERHLKTWSKNRVSPLAKNSAVGSLKYIQIALEKAETAIVAAEDTAYFQLVMHLTRVLQQTVVYQYNLAPGLRDSYLYENFDWWTKYDVGEDKIIYYGHNIHVSKSRVTSEAIKVLGGFLLERYGKDYYAIAGEFGMGRFWSRRTSIFPTLRQYKSGKRSGELSKKLRSMKKGDYIIPLSPFGQHWFNGLLQMHMVGEYYYPGNVYFQINPYKSFDALYFFGNVRPSTLLGKPK